MTRYKLFHYLLVVGTITVFGGGDKSPARRPKAEKSEESVVMLVAKSMAQDSVKDDTKAIHSEPATIKPIELKLLVKEGHRDGQLVQNASVELFYTSSDGLTEEKLAAGKTDSAGRVTLNVPWYRANTGSGSYHVAVTNGSKTNRAKLERFPEVKQYTLYAPVRPPEKLMKVTLECEEGLEIFAVPLLSAGVDVVNYGGKGRNARSGGRRLSIEYLPSAVIYATIKLTGSGDTKKQEGEILLPLLSSDNEKTLRLHVSGPCVYMNNDLVFVAFTEISNPGTWIQKSAPKHSDKRRDTLRYVIIGTYDKYLPVLQWLKSSGIGVGINVDTEKIGEGDSEKTKVIPLSKKCARSLVDARPKYLFCGDCGNVKKAAIPFRDLTNLKNLIVFNDAKDSLEAYQIPLAGLTKLRHLNVHGCIVSSTELSKLANLRSLSFFLFYDHSQSTLPDLKVLAKMPQLRLLTILFENADEMEILNKLPRLQHLTAVFPVNTDFSFAERMPYLQTLGILNITEAHDLVPLAKHPSLKCLALRESGGGSFDEISAFDNVKKFKRSRPDVLVIEYHGMCLGSFWLLPLAALAGIVAWLIRRRRCYGVCRG